MSLHGRLRASADELPRPGGPRVDAGRAVGDAVAAVQRASVIGTGGNPDMARHLSSMGDPPIIDFPRERRG